MSKELEALEGLKTSCFYDNERNEYVEDTDEFKTIEQGLQRLEAIDNAKPSEALKDLECVGRWKLSEDYVCDTINESDEYDTIKQTLIKAQEQEDKAKAFDLINEKDVDIKLLKWAYPSAEAYNTKVRVEKDYWWRKELTQEEFEFIGRLVGAK